MCGLYLLRPLLPDTDTFTLDFGPGACTESYTCPNSSNLEFFEHEPTELEIIEYANRCRNEILKDPETFIMKFLDKECGTHKIEIIGNEKCLQFLK